nr:hypothetical protein [Tanacetum cinerariifolium]
MEVEEDDEEEMEVEDNNDKNDAEIIHPYEEVNPLNRPPPSPETAEQEFMNAPVSRSTLQPLPPIRVYPLGPIVNDPSTLYSRIKTLTIQMWDRYRVESSSFKRLKKNDMRMDSFDDDLTADAAATVPTKDDDEGPAVPSDPQIMPPRKMTQVAIEKLIADDIA